MECVAVHISRVPSPRPRRRWWPGLRCSCSCLCLCFVRFSQLPFAAFEAFGPKVFLPSLPDKPSPLLPGTFFFFSRCSPCPVLLPKREGREVEIEVEISVLTTSGSRSSLHLPGGLNCSKIHHHLRSNGATLPPAILTQYLGT